MSRTFRRSEIPLDYNDLPVTWKEFYVQHDHCTCRRCHVNHRDYFSKRNLKRDEKPWYKPSKCMKTIWKRIRRAKVKNALRSGRYNQIPLFKK